MTIILGCFKNQSAKAAWRKADKYEKSKMGIYKCFRVDTLANHRRWY